MSETKREPTYFLAEFDGPGGLLEAAKKVRDAGYKMFDCHSPFPIHGMDQAMGLKRSPLGVIVFLCAFTGVFSMIALTYWVSVEAYPLIISGKPLFSYPAYAPPIFAIGVLTGGITSLLGMLALNKLPRPHHPLFNSESFSRATSDGFFVSIEAESSEDENKIKSFLSSIGGKNVEVIKGE